MNYEFQVVSFEYSPSPSRTGFVIVKYGVMLLTCEIFYLRQKNKFFIRLPQRSDNPKKPHVKFNVAYIEGKENSDRLQEQVMNQLREKYPNAFVVPSKEEVQKFREIIMLNRQDKTKEQPKKQVKAVNEDIKIEEGENKTQVLKEEEKQFQKLKARSQSKFSQKSA